MAAQLVDARSRTVAAKNYRPTSWAPLVACGRCGQPAPVSPYGIWCPCTPAESASEHYPKIIAQDKITKDKPRAHS